MKIKSLLLILVLVLFTSCSAKTEKQSKFTVGYLPSEDSTEMQNVKADFAKELSEKIGIPVETFQSTSYSAAIEAVTSGKIDMVQLSPFSYVVAEKKGGAHILVNLEMATQDPNQPAGCIFVSKDSPLKSVDEIKGKTFAFGDPASTTGHLIPKYYMMQHFNVSVKDIEENMFKEVLFSGGHDKTILGVIQGTYDAGASYCLMPDMLAEKGVINKDDLRVLASFGPELGVQISATPVVVRDGLDKDLEAKVKEFMLGYENEDYFKGLTGGVKAGKYVEGDNSVYEGMRKMSEALELSEEEMMQ